MTQYIHGGVNRRKFLGMTAAGTLMATASANLFSRATAQSSRPNVVFILVDDMGWGDLSIYGRTDYETPNLDRLARQGVRFTNAYANQTVCTPTRIAFLTGRYQARLPVGLREPLGARSQPASNNIGIPANQPTIASLLKANGYETALVGKWHAGYPPNFGPLQKGFDEYFGHLSGGIEYFTHTGTDRILDLYENDVPVQRSGYVTDLFTDRAVEFIQRPHSRPFYLSLHYNAPHWPWQGPNDQASTAFYLTNGYTVGGSQATYAAMVKSLDDGVGRVLDALEASGQADNTLVIFTSDNGGERFSNFGPFRGQKASLYEGGIRVPAIIRYPGVTQANQVSNQVIITFDLTATILAATGTSFHPNYPPDGQNLLPLLRGDRREFSRTLFWRYGAALTTRQRAVRSGDWKYWRRGNQEALFNLATDPGETTDLKDSNAQVFTRLRNQFQHWELQMLPYGS
ncbi:sulfatase [Anabaena sp. CCY 9910]|uniref:sulfatase n=1 Tax=Anabaena sp. CCY 9910 TaxID=3103870 RepID=UPI0039E1A0A7